MIQVLPTHQMLLAVNLAQALGKEKLLNYYEKFGFGTKTGIELPNEYNGQVEAIYESELASISMVKV